MVLDFETIGEILNSSVNIKINPTEQCISVMLFIMTYFLSLWVNPEFVTIQMKATEQYFPVVLFIMLYKVVLTFESVDEVLKCDHSNESD